MDTQFKELHGDLRRIAHALMRQERIDHTLETNAIVSQLYLRICSSGLPSWADSRESFLRLARRLMKQELIAHARGRAAAKRGGRMKRVGSESLDSAQPRSAPHVDRTLRPRVQALLEDAVSNGLIAPNQAAAFTLRTFLGCSSAEVADLLDMKLRTVQHACSTVTAFVAATLEPSA